MVEMFISLATQSQQTPPTNAETPPTQHSGLPIQGLRSIYQRGTKRGVGLVVHLDQLLCPADSRIRLLRLSSILPRAPEDS